MFMTMAWMALKGRMPVVTATAVVGGVCLAIGLLSLRGMKESFAVDLDVMEK